MIERIEEKESYGDNDVIVVDGEEGVNGEEDKGVGVAYVRDCYSDQHTCVNIENDEVIACALQEKLSRLSLQESIGSKSKASWKNCSFALDDNEDDTNTVTSSFNRSIEG
ncbi:hypothetical protein FXO38_14119 [Capsicum annuum]|nr:hypothetical protein FXO37_23623 [Capsicum annuum]KAF3656497.1 hypothetical protein FXO38_14119 [Capsicum annuum]